VKTLKFSLRILSVSFLLLLPLGCDSRRPESEPSDAVTAPAPIARITPVRPIEELRSEALQAQPPVETGDFLAPDLVDLASLSPDYQFDIRYASDRNFLGVPVYDKPAAFMQRPAALALTEVLRELTKQGLGLLIYDSYRPWFVTRIFWDATPLEFKDYVADPQKGSRHNRGCAVDLTIYDLKSGHPVPMPSGYDEFSDRAHPDYTGGTEVERSNRDLLRRMMESHGFQVYPIEWWHFDYRDWSRYPIMNVRFAELSNSGPAS